MPINLTEEDNGRILDVKVSGKLAHEDFKLFIQRFDQLVKQHGRIRILCDLVSFDGWEASAMWDEIKWDVSSSFLNAEMPGWPPPESPFPRTRYRRDNNGGRDEDCRPIHRREELLWECSDLQCGYRKHRRDT